MMFKITLSVIAADNQVKLKDDSYFNFPANLKFAIDIINNTSIKDEVPKLHMDVLYSEQCNFEFSTEELAMIVKAGCPLEITCWESKLKRPEG